MFPVQVREMTVDFIEIREFLNQNPQISLEAADFSEIHRFTVDFKKLTSMRFRHVIKLRSFKRKTS